MSRPMKGNEKALLGGPFFYYGVFTVPHALHPSSRRMQAMLVVLPHAAHSSLQQPILRHGSERYCLIASIASSAP